VPDEQHADVLVVGAGPTGLAVAAELALAGAAALVLDALPERSGQSKALALQPRSAELLDARGWLDPLQPHIRAFLPAGHFAGLPLDYAVLETPFPHQIAVEQARVEELLERRLASSVRWAHACTAIRQGREGVAATVETPAGAREFTARYLVAADGAHSTVRRLLGDPFPGRPARMRMAVADIVLARKPPGLGEEWAPPEFGGGGFGYLLPLGGGVHRVLFGGEEQQGLDRTAPVTAEEVQRALEPLHGEDVEVGEVRWGSRFGDASRQVEQYRHGRVLLAGDAAHVHLPAGGQGLNLGLQDAFNLGWKLAAAIRGHGRPLDTYHGERHPVAARVLVNTRAQGVLTVPDPDLLALREILGDLLADPSANRRIAGEVSGLDIRYPMPGRPHPLLGARLPHTIATGPIRASLRAGRPMLLDATGAQALRDAAEPWLDRVDHLPLRGARTGAEGLLVRPDGHLCWATADGHDLRGLTDALEHWFGGPAVAEADHTDHRSDRIDAHDH
jgi:2-polyprenyl-6-methoxyphenol hydroxylase-like FAD-dependent oxidoreductase